MSREKTGIKRQVTPVPKNLDEAAEFLCQIGKERRAIDKIQANLNEQVDELKTQAMADAGPHQEKVNQLVEGLFAFAEANRNELTDGGKHKTVELPTGIFAWRMTPPAVNLRGVKEIIASLKTLGLTRFIRTKEEVDKEAMLKEKEVAATVKGVTISQQEEFVVKPAELEVEIVSSTDKLKKVVA